MLSPEGEQASSDSDDIEQEGDDELNSKLRQVKNESDHKSKEDYKV